MTRRALKRLDREKLPPFWEDVSVGNFAEYQLQCDCWGYDFVATTRNTFAETWDYYDRESAPAVEGRMAQLVEWLREDIDLPNTCTPTDSRIRHTIDVFKALADEIESRRWRK